MKHLSARELNALFDQALEGRARAEAERHLEGCAACREALAALESQDRALRETLLHDPGEEYFEGFAARVDERIRAGEQVERVQAERSRGLVGWWTQPRRLAWVGGAAAVLAAIGLVLITARESPIPELRRPEVLERGDQVGRAPAPEAAREEEAPSTGAGGAFAKAPESEPAGRDRAVAERHLLEADEAAPAPVPAPPTASEAGATLQNEARKSVVDDRAGAASRPVPIQPGEETPIGAARSYGLARPPAAPPSGEAPRIPRPSPLPLAGAPPSEAEKPQAATQERIDRLPVAQVPDMKARGAATAAAAVVCGVVLDHSGRPIAGAQIVLADLGVVAVSDRDGRYCVGAPAGEHTLSVMAVGFQTRRQPVRAVPGTTAVDVTLEAVAVLGGPMRVRGARAPADSGAAPRFRWPAAVAAAAGRAEATTERATRLGSAELFDRAAEEWGQVLARAGGGAAELEARARMADARYRAWEIAPTARRQAAAIEALTAYLKKAPAGSARDLAARRLERVERGIGAPAPERR